MSTRKLHDENKQCEEITKFPGRREIESETHARVRRVVLIITLFDDTAAST